MGWVPITHHLLPTTNILNGILHARFRESLEAQRTGITAPAGTALRIRIVAARRKRVIHAERPTQPNDVAFRHVDQRSANARAFTFDTRPRGEVRHTLIRL